MRIKGVIFDFIGTTVIEKDPSLVNRCFEQAFLGYGVPVKYELIKANRGKDKKEMITDVLHQSGRPSSLIGPVLNAFKKNLEDNLGNFSENKGAGGIIRYMKQRKMIVGLGTGLPRDIFERIFHHLGWGDITFDYIGIASETGRGRPHPDMILDMLQKCGLKNTELLKVGDTVSDIQEGKNANVRTAAILSGTQDENEIARQQPDFIIRNLSELKEMI